MNKTILDQTPIPLINARVGLPFKALIDAFKGLYNSLSGLENKTKLEKNATECLSEIYMESNPSIRLDKIRDMEDFLLDSELSYVKEKSIQEEAEEFSKLDSIFNDIHDLVESNHNNKVLIMNLDSWYKLIRSPLSVQFLASYLNEENLGWSIDQENVFFIKNSN